MFKTVLTTLFLIVGVSPIFAIISVRDTMPMQQCDTLIDKEGRISPVRIVSVGTDFITFKQCIEDAKRTYTVKRNAIREIKAHTFTEDKPVPLLIRAKRARGAAIFGLVLFSVSVGLLIASSSGFLILPYLGLLISPFILVASLFSSIFFLNKAQKAKDTMAAQVASGGIIISLLPILIVILILRRN
jgi:hypothetical protein